MDDHLRICMVPVKFSPAVGGAEIRAEKQARKFQALGHEVLVVTLRVQKQWKKREKLDGLPVVRVGGIYRRTGQLRMGKLGYLAVNLAMFITLWQLRHRFDVIHVYQITFLAAIPVLIGKIFHKPVVISHQSTGPTAAQLAQLDKPVLMADTLERSDFLKIGFRDWAEGGDDIATLADLALGGQLIVNFLRKSNAFYQALSIRGRNHLIGHGFQEEHIVHIAGSVDTVKFRPLPERRPDAERPERDMLCVARMEYSKGVDVLLHAWARMMRLPADWRQMLKPRLLLVGEGKLKPQMERIVTELGIQDSVQFLGLRTDVIDLLQQSWGFVLPSRWEGMPNALLEAMSCGLPCIATRVSGSEDIIANGINGLLVEPEQPAEMAKALQRLIEDTELAQRLGREGRATVVHSYQLDKVVEQLLELYYRLLSKTENTHHKTSKAEALALQTMNSNTLDDIYARVLSGGESEE